MNANDEYLRGLRDGELKALEGGVARAHERLDHHDKRITAQERITYAVLGAISLVQIAPALSKLLT